MRRSALATRLEQYLRLSDDERGALEAIEQRERRLRGGEVLVEQGEVNDLLYIVEQGWLHGSAKLPGGEGRQIIRFYYAGDLMGLSNLAWAKTATTLTAVSDCIVADLPKAELGEIFARHPRLAGLLYAVAAAENVAMADRMTSVGRMSAQARIATLLLDILARLRVTDGGVVTTFDLPLTQQDIGDAVGLTKVHVSRMMTELERAGMIARTGRRYKIVDEPALVAMTGFVDRYRSVETNWLPTAA